MKETAPNIRVHMRYISTHRKYIIRLNGCMYHITYPFIMYMLVHIANENIYYAVGLKSPGYVFRPKSAVFTLNFNSNISKKRKKKEKYTSKRLFEDKIANQYIYIINRACVCILYYCMPCTKQQQQNTGTCVFTSYL